MYTCFKRQGTVDVSSRGPALLLPTDEQWSHRGHVGTHGCAVWCQWCLGTVVTRASAEQCGMGLGMCFSSTRDLHVLSE